MQIMDTGLTVRGATTLEGGVTVSGGVNVLGTGVNVQAGDVFVSGGNKVGINVESPSHMLSIKGVSSIGVPVIRNAQGIDDLSVHSASKYTGHTDAIFEVMIHAQGSSDTGVSDSFVWRKITTESSTNQNGPYSAPIFITAVVPVILDEGVYVYFDHNFGHAQGATWQIVVEVDNAVSVQNAAGAETFTVGQDGAVFSAGGAVIAGGLTLPNSGLVVSSGDLAVEVGDDRIMTVNENFEVSASSVDIDSTSNGIDISSNADVNINAVDSVSVTSGSSTFGISSSGGHQASFFNDTATTEIYT
eukprot:COSAG01_NODE_20669_length_941_cov_1.068884_1_plen_302_part_10